MLSQKRPNLQAPIQRTFSPDSYRVIKITTFFFSIERKKSLSDYRRDNVSSLVKDTTQQKNLIDCGLLLQSFSSLLSRNQ
jgi:hypothetical protein